MPGNPEPPKADPRRVERLAVRGYRSLADVDLRLGDVTVVVGPSRSGKSCLIRAIRDLVQNPAVPPDVVQHGKSIIRVSLTMGSGHVVTWEKGFEGKRGLAYVIRSPSGETVSHEKVGRDVPQEVRDLTGIFAFEVDSQETWLNLAEQPEPWFLLAPPWTSSAVGRLVGKVCGIEALVLALGDVIARRQKLSRQAEESRLQARERREGAEALAPIPVLLTRLAEIESRNAVLERDRLRLSRATDAGRRLKAVRLERTAVAAAVRAGARLAALELPRDLLNLTRLERELAGVRAQRESAKNAAVVSRRAVAEARRGLEELAAREGECPVCGAGVHPECRAELTRLAQEA